MCSKLSIFVRNATVNPFQDVVRAVAGLLNHLRALKSADTAAFNDDYKQAVVLYRNMRKTSKGDGQGKVHQ